MAVNCEAGDARALATMRNLGGCMGAQRERCWLLAGLLFVVAAGTGGRLMSVSAVH